MEGPPLLRISYHIGTFGLDILIFAKMVRPGKRELESCGLASRSGVHFGNVLADMDFAPAQGLAMSLGRDYEWATHDIDCSA